MELMLREVQSEVQSRDGDKEKWVMHSRILTAEHGIQGDIHGNMERAKTENVFLEIAQETRDRWRVESSVCSLSPPTFTCCRATSRMGVFLNLSKCRRKSEIWIWISFFRFRIKLRSCRLVFTYSFRSSSFLSQKASCNMAN